MKDGQAQQWERGLNRIADLRLVSDHRQEYDMFASFAIPNTEYDVAPKKKENIKTIEIMDIWEAFTIKF